MNVLIFGANGQIGKMIAEKMKESPDFNPTAVIRKKEQQDAFDSLGIPTQLADLEGSIEELASIMDGQDTVLFTAGSGGKTGPDKTLTVDLDGAVKTMEAAVQKNVKRYVIVSALKTGDRDAWNDSPIKPYYVAKYYADEFLKSSGLDYTILRPGRLQDDAGTGKITIDDPASQPGVAREDVAALAIEVLKHVNTIGKVISFNNGDDPIPEVVRGI